MTQTKRQRAYTLVLTDKTERVITEQQAKSIEASLTRSTDGYVRVEGMLVKKAAIQSVRPGGYTEADQSPWADRAHQLPAGEGCTGSKSIQKAINGLAQQLSGKKTEDNPEGAKWSDLVRDSDWRQMMRAQLLEETEEWCDGPTGRCVCP